MNSMSNICAYFTTHSFSTFFDLPIIQEPYATIAR